MTSAREHCLRSIDADDVDTACDEWMRDAARSTSELEDAAPRLPRDVRPERDVAAPERARVFPVVKWRVLVPPQPPFRGAMADFGFWISDFGFLLHRRATSVLG